MQLYLVTPFGASFPFLDIKSIKFKKPRIKAFVGDREKLGVAF
jgi:hypothetical protein